MTAFRYTALVTLAMAATMFWAAVLVARARTRYDIKAPAVSGHEMFERAYRAQMNTLEQAVVMLPTMWLMAGWVNDKWAALAGLVWIAGRILYINSYAADPAKRGPGFAITFLAFAAAWIASLVAVGMAFLR